MRTAHGFTLVEALITMFLISLMVISIFSVFPQTRKGLAHSENRMNAAFLCKSLLDEQRGKGFQAVAPSTGSYTYSGVNNDAPSNQSFDYTVNVQATGTDKKQVWVVVTWKDQVGPGQLTMETVLVNL
jgi:Tfp pilus assembly protein PilV